MSIRDPGSIQDDRNAADVYVYGLVDGSPQEFCNDEQPHKPHEFLVGMKSFQCPGLPFGGPDKSATAVEQFRALVWDALADISGHVVMDDSNGQIAVLDLNNSRVWLVTVQAGQFEVAS